MIYQLVKDCKNVYSIESSYNPKGKVLSVEDVSNFTLIIGRSGFDVQKFVKKFQNQDIYYIEKYDVILTYPQAEEFCKAHPEEKFLLVDDYKADLNEIYFYITSEPDNLTVHCFHAVGGGHMSMFAIIKNVPNASKWQKPEIVQGSLCESIQRYDERYSYRYSNDEENNNFYFKFKGYSSDIEQGHLININKLDDRTNMQEIMRQCIRLTGKTRITRTGGRYNNSFFKYETGRHPSKEDKSIIERYGLEIPKEKSYNWSLQYGGEWMWKNEYFDSEIPQEDLDRVTKRIKAKLENMDKNDPDFFSKILETAELVITAPIPGHRRPSFHLIKGFRCNHITEIVELARGELLMKDMTPENIYCLFTDGNYRLVMYDIKSAMRDMICDHKRVEIDPESFNKWAEERSLHPELLKLLNESYFETIDLETVKLFNRLPFGALLIDQLITSNKPRLAINLATYITNKAYDFNQFCGRLQDLFPECNGEETSLYKILNISRNTAKYLFSDTEDNSVDYFIAKYKAIHHYGGNMVLNDVALGNVETYLSLFKSKAHKFTLSWGNREFDFLDHPKLAKSIVKMRRKIAALTGLTTSQLKDITNKYDEIVRAYCSFLDYSTIAPAEEHDFWLPEHQRIFVEFSLTGTPDHPLNPVEELGSREKDANKALKIYQDKANEKIKKENEEKYAFRKTVVNKLRSYADLEKQMPDFRGYVVIAPSQIYGWDVEGSVEKEANDLDHCLFRCYTNRIVAGEYTTMWLRLKATDNRSLITIGITEDGRIEQTRGEHDRDATVAEAKAIAAWAKSKSGMVTFKSEGTDVQPGGWPRNVAVPSLPKPDKDWLKRLAQNHEVFVG